MNPVNQKEIDEKMKEIDGTDNKGKLGANAILAVSLAVCKVALDIFACMLWAATVSSVVHHDVSLSCRLEQLRRASPCTGTSLSWRAMPRWCVMCCVIGCVICIELACKTVDNLAKCLLHVVNLDYV